MKKHFFPKILAAAAILIPMGLPLSAAENDVKPVLKKHARSVIEIWVWGGPSQLESFDPKPDAPQEYNGGYKAIPTNVPGISISEFWPEMAKIADKYSIIRSMTHPHNGHETATYLMQTGRMPGGMPRQLAENLSAGGTFRPMSF